jgi:hypothetical protein
MMGPTIDPDNLLQFRKRLNVAGEFLCGLTTDPKAREAYIAVLYVQSSLALEAKEMKLAAEEAIQLTHLKEMIDARLNDHLCEMKPDYDDSIAGFNEAWDIVRKVFDDYRKVL